MNHEDEDLIKSVIKLLRDIPKYDPYFSSVELKEENELDSKLQMKDAQIQHLKDRLRIEQETIRSLRNQIKVLKQR
jgi:hypothetical protein